MAEARRLLTAKELAEFRWDVRDYIKYGEQNAVNPAWMQQLENASARFHISRLEALKLQTQHTVEKLFGGQYDAVDRLMKKTYLDNYYHTLYEVQKGINIGWDVAAVDDRTLGKLISKPWAADGKNFSERIWSNKAGLINEVHTQLTQTVMLGKAPDDAIKTIAKKMGVSKNQAGRLVMTESAYFSSQSQKDAFNELDVEQFEIVATLDSRTSEICQELDGRVFDMKVYEPGTTAPPFHVWCRSTTVPYFDDNFMERAARGADGKTYYVDGQLKYPDWKKTFAEGGSKDDLKEALQFGTGRGIIPEGTVEELNDPGILITDEASLQKGLEEFKKHIEVMPEPYKGVYRYYAENTKLISDPAQLFPIGYDPQKDALTYNAALFSSPKYQQYSNMLFSHELAHRYDILVIKSWKSKPFTDAINSAAQKITENLTAFNDLYKTLSDVNPAFQDIVGALSDNRISTQFGHDILKGQIRAAEIFSNLSYIKANAIEIPNFNGLLDEIISVFETAFTGGI